MVFRHNPESEWTNIETNMHACTEHHRRDTATLKRGLTDLYCKLFIAGIGVDIKQSQYAKIGEVHPTDVARSTEEEQTKSSMLFQL